MSACFSCGNDHGNPHDLAVHVLSLAAENEELRLEISEHVLRADSLRAELRRLEEEMGEADDQILDADRKRDEALAEVERLTRVIAEAVRLTDEYLEDEDSLVTDDPFTEGTCQVASEIRAILKGES